MKPAGWTQLLAQLQEALNKTSAEVDRQDEALTTPLAAGDAPGGRYEDWQQQLERVSQRLQECQTRVQQAGRQAEQAEAVLAEQEKQVEQMRERMAGIKQKLAQVPAVVIE